MPTTTAKGFTVPTDGDGVNVADDLLELVNDLEARVPIWDAGPVGSRPVSTPGSPGIAGRRYYASDEGIEYIDTGTSWIIGKINAAAIPDASITAAKIAASLKPSGTAAAGDEALRAIGATASTVVAGNDSRLTNQRTPSDGSVTRSKLQSGFADTLQKRVISWAGVIYAADTSSGDFFMLSNGRIGKEATDLDHMPITKKLTQDDVQVAGSFIYHQCKVRVTLQTGNTAPGSNLTRFTLWVDPQPGGTPAAGKLQINNNAYNEGGAYIAPVNGARVAPGALTANTLSVFDSAEFYFDTLAADDAFHIISPGITFGGALAANSIVGVVFELIVYPG